MTRGTLSTEVLIRSGKDTTSGWVSDTILNDWLSQAHRWSANFKKWPFPEGRVSTTWASSTEEWDFEGYQADSFRFLQIGGKMFQKVNFQDYLLYREKRTSGQDKVYSDFGGLLFINPQADVSGTLTAYGKFMPPNFDATDNTTETVFTEGNDEGNQAIIEEVLSYAFRRDGNEQEALSRHNLAIDHLNRLWEKVKEEMAHYHDHNITGGQWRRMNILRGEITGDLTEDRFF